MQAATNFSTTVNNAGINIPEHIQLYPKHLVQSLIHSREFEKCAEWLNACTFFHIFKYFCNLIVELPGMNIFMAITVMFQKGYTIFQCPWQHKQHLFEMFTSAKNAKTSFWKLKVYNVLKYFINSCNNRQQSQGICY